MPNEPLVIDDVPGHLLTLLGMSRVDDPDDGPVLEMALRPEVCNPHGGLHGGLMTAFIECGAAGIAVRAGGSQNIVASDCTTRFLAPVIIGPARIVGHALRVGRRAIIVQADVVDLGADRKLCATATLAYARLDAS